MAGSGGQATACEGWRWQPLIALGIIYGQHVLVSQQLAVGMSASDGVASVAQGMEGVVCTGHWGDPCWLHLLHLEAAQDSSTLKARQLLLNQFDLRI